MQLRHKQWLLAILLSVSTTVILLTVLIVSRPAALMPTQERLGGSTVAPVAPATTSVNSEVTPAIYLPATWPELVIRTPVTRNGRSGYEPPLGPPCDQIRSADVSWYGVVSGQRVQVCAGASRSDSERGALGVQILPGSATSPVGVESDTSPQDHIYLTPERHGRITLLYLAGNVLTLQAANAGYRFYFDVAALQWVSTPSATPAPGAIPILLVPDWTLKLTREQLDQAHDKWRSHRIDEYQIAVSIFDLSVGEHLEGEYAFRVRGNRVELVKRMPRYFPKYHSEGYDGSLETRTASVNWEGFLQDYTIEALFSNVGAMVDSADPEYCQVQLNVTYGFPDRILCKRKIDDIYEVRDISVFSFQPLNPQP